MAGTSAALRMLLKINPGVDRARKGYGTDRRVGSLILIIIATCVSFRSTKSSATIATVQYRRALMTEQGDAGNRYCLNKANGTSMKEPQAAEATKKNGRRKREDTTWVIESK